MYVIPLLIFETAYDNFSTTEYFRKDNRTVDSLSVELYMRWSNSRVKNNLKSAKIHETRKIKISLSCSSFRHFTENKARLLIMTLYIYCFHEDIRHGEQMVSSRRCSLNIRMGHSSKTVTHIRRALNTRTRIHHKGGWLTGNNKGKFSASV